MTSREHAEEIVRTLDAWLEAAVATNDPSDARRRLVDAIAHALDEATRKAVEP